MTNLETLDRRAFLRGLMVTSAGLVVPRPTILVPAPLTVASPEEVKRFYEPGYAQWMMGISYWLKKGNQ